ncbi:hypothetical protein OY671_007810, partial [Metschnikowia pulcherrima]
LQLAQDAPRARQQRFPRAGQGEAARGASEQGDAQRPFQFRQPFADHRLRQPQPPRCRADRGFVHRGDKGGQAIELHHRSDFPSASSGIGWLVRTMHHRHLRVQRARRIGHLPGSPRWLRTQRRQTMNDFTGKNVLVLGGSRGIGAAIVRRFRAAGAARNDAIGKAMVALAANPADKAAEYVFGYCVGNDVTERMWQHAGPQWSLGKSFDTHAPMGPWSTTADDVADPHASGIRCFVNGEKRQDSNTRNSVFNSWQQIEHLSQAMTSEPGDVIFTGTPGGVGAAMDPRQFSKPGDVPMAAAAIQECDVLIAGGGPTGVTSALLLARQGVSVIVAEKEAEVYPSPRAAHLDHEIIRVFQEVGAAEAIVRSSRQSSR